MNRMRNIISADLVSSDSTSSVSIPEPIEPNSLMATTTQIESSSSEEECDNKESESQSNGQSKDTNNSTTRVSYLPSLVSKHYLTDDSDSDEQIGVNHLREPAIHCPYKHTLCHATPSASNTNDKSSISLKKS